MLGFPFSEPLNFLSLVIVAVTFVVHVTFAIGIYGDGQRHRTYFVPPMIWGLAVLLGGVVSVTLYWLIHHSAFHRD